MKPLRVTALLDGALGARTPVALDALLAWAVAQRDGVEPAATADEVVDLEIPVARSACGRVYLASFAQYAPEASEKRFVQRRFPIEEAQAIGAASIKRIQINAGPSKSYRIPHELQRVERDEVTWWCLGDAGEIRELLEIVTHLGRRRAVGWGRIREWRVEPCEPWDGFPVVRDGVALRTLPLDWPGLVSPEPGYATLRPPYWLREREELCALVPPPAW